MLSITVGDYKPYSSFRADWYRLNHFGLIDFTRVLEEVTQSRPAGTNQRCLDYL